MAVRTGSQFTDHNELVDPASGWTLTKANDINDHGWIVGEGTDSDGLIHAFLLQPVEEPPPRAVPLPAMLWPALLTASTLTLRRNCRTNVHGGPAREACITRYA